MNYIETLVERLKREKYNGGSSSEFSIDASRIRKGEPYEYVLGHTMFLGAYIDLSLRPMIPRPESAFWVERAIKELKEKEESIGRSLRLAEVFAGAGPIGCALLTHFPTAQVDICELDPNLKKQIEINVEKNTVDRSRVRMVTASALEGLIGKYDAIFAIPPYIPYKALPELDQDMIDYEPHMAFLAHDDGHEFLEILIKQGRDYLNEGGTLYLEADIDDNEVITKLSEGVPWSKLEFWPDPYGATPNAILRR